jgi:hypothetical protein
MGDGRAEIVLQRVALAQALVHFGVEEPHLAPVRLGPIERRIGIRKQRLDVAAVAGIERGPDAEADGDFLRADLEVLGDIVPWPTNSDSRI